MDKKLLIVLSVVGVILLCIICSVCLVLASGAAVVNESSDTIQQNFSDARNAQRSSDVNQIVSGIIQYTSMQENSINDLGDVSNCNDGTAIIGTSEIDLEEKLVPLYMVTIPKDPQVGTTQNTGYTICIDSDKRVNITAPNAEGTTIAVKR